MRCGGFHNITRRKARSQAGKELDAAFARHEIGWAHYWKIKDKKKYWKNNLNANPEDCCNLRVELFKR